jgi:hypothetical protein
VSASARRLTRITVTKRTRLLLEAVKGRGESFDDVISALLEESFYDDEFTHEINRRWQTEKRVPGRQVLMRAGLA